MNNKSDACTQLYAMDFIILKVSAPNRTL